MTGFKHLLRCSRSLDSKLQTTFKLVTFRLHQAHFPVAANTMMQYCLIVECGHPTIPQPIALNIVGTVLRQLRDLCCWM